MSVPELPIRLLTLAVVLGAFVASIHAQPKSAPKVDPKAPYAVIDTGGHSASIRGVAFHAGWQGRGDGIEGSDRVRSGTWPRAMSFG